MSDKPSPSPHDRNLQDLERRQQALELDIQTARLVVCEVALACRWRLELGRLHDAADALQALLDRRSELELRVKILARGRKGAQ